VYALKHDADAAFEWLQRAKATRRLDMTQVETDADLAALKDDARFRALLPSAEDFHHSFGEDVRVLREWDGEAGGDQFGWIARRVGDVDGDHVVDIVTSAPTKDVGGANAGRVYVYSTKTGRLVWTVSGKPGDQLGIGIEAAGDTNRDGIPDVVASAPGAGKAYVFSGRDGRVLLTLTAEKQSDMFGRHVSGVGDIDHDGYADVIVGAPANAAGGEGAGRAYVYSGKDGRVLLTLTGEAPNDGFGSAVAGSTVGARSFLLVGAPGAGPKHAGRTYVYTGLTSKPAFVIDADESGIALGAMFLSTVGDVDHDGVPDVYASDFSNAAKGPATGRVYVHSGANGKRLLTLTGETAGDGFGIGPADAGDVDGDGFDDLIVGAWQYSATAISAGRAYVYSGRDGRLLKTFTCRIPGDTFGFDATGMGDVDGDGTIDFLITSAWSGIHGFHSGRMFVVSSGVSRAPRAPQ
jgi:FG-GAP repeat